VLYFPCFVLYSKILAVSYQARTVRYGVVALIMLVVGDISGYAAISRFIERNLLSPVNGLGVVGGVKHAPSPVSRFNEARPSLEDRRLF